MERTELNSNDIFNGLLTVAVVASCVVIYKKFRNEQRLGPICTHKSIMALPAERRIPILMYLSRKVDLSIDQLAQRVWQLRPAHLRTWSFDSAAWAKHIGKLDKQMTKFAYRLTGTGWDRKAGDAALLTLIKERASDSALYALARECYQTVGERGSSWIAGDWAEHLRNLQSTSDSPLGERLREVTNFEALADGCVYVSCRIKNHDLVFDAPYKIACPTKISVQEYSDMEDFLDAMRWQRDVGITLDPKLDFFSLTAANAQKGCAYFWNQLSSEDRLFCEELLKLYR